MSIETDYATLRRVIHEHNPQGWAVEFGVYSGYSLAIIAEHMPVIGFDSFEGLPEDWREGFPKGTFGIGVDPEDGSSIQDVLVMGQNRMVVTGWFEDTVPSFPFPPLGLVHIDCDLYSSTVTALDAITPYVDFGTILVFDEFYNYPGHEDHEKRAFEEWLLKTGIQCGDLAWGQGENAQEAAFQITMYPGFTP